MKITKTKLKQIIQEELEALENTLSEQDPAANKPQLSKKTIRRLKQSGLDDDYIKMMINKAGFTDEMFHKQQLERLSADLTSIESLTILDDEALLKDTTPQEFFANWPNDRRKMIQLIRAIDKEARLQGYKK